MKKFNLKMTYCIKCGVPIGTLSICHACRYIQDAIYEEWKLDLEDGYITQEEHNKLIYEQSRTF
jgi:hypothetical protein